MALRTDRDAGQIGAREEEQGMEGGYGRTYPIRTAGYSLRVRDRPGFIS